ncbi:MAG: addiction module protein [Pseudomonadota bacterium]
MPNRIDEIIAEISVLSLPEKQEILAFLVDALEGEVFTDIDQAWNAEADRRERAIDSGEIDTLDGEKVITAIRATLRK